MLIGLHEAIPVSPACRQESRSTSPQLSTYQRRCPITAVWGKPQGRDSILNFVFKGRPRSRLMRHWRSQPARRARLQRFLQNINPVSPFVSQPSRWQYVRLLPHQTHVAVNGTSGATQPWENRHDPPAGLLVGGAAPPGHHSSKWRTPISILQRKSDWCP